MVAKRNAVISSFQTVCLVICFLLMTTTCLQIVFADSQPPKLAQKIFKLVWTRNKLNIVLNRSNTSAGIAATPILEIGLEFSKQDDNDSYTVQNMADNRCLEIEWTTKKNISLVHCINLQNNQWYGGPGLNDQYWPIQEAVINASAYIITDYGNGQVIAEPYWLNSEGLFIYVDPEVPLFIDQNNSKKKGLCVIARNAPPYRRTGALKLKYSVCKFDDPRSAHEFAVANYLGKPTGIPSPEMVTYPLWSTGVRHKYDSNENKILRFAHEIKDNGFKNSQLQIDGSWQYCTGSLSFDETKFPNITKMTGELHKLGFRISTWASPFINFDCDVIELALDKGYLVRNTNGKTGTSGYIDLTNPAAAAWFKTRLSDMLKESGIDFLEFFHESSRYTPQIPVFKNSLDSEHPEIITRKYIQLAAEFGQRVTVHAGKGTQNLPIFVQMLSRYPFWGIKNRGLHSVITTTFQMNFNGYPFVRPDAVGGYDEPNQQISKELFIRSLQVNTFLPTIQFSIPPWHFDDETVKLSKKFVELHEKYADEIVKLMRKCVETGQPLNPPIWWVDPTNPTAHAINSEYLLGEDILVAPVIEEGATSRDIYLPKGVWVDEANPKRPNYTGPVWIRDYPAPLDTLPYFTQVISPGDGGSTRATTSVDSSAPTASPPHFTSSPIPSSPNTQSTPKHSTPLTSSTLEPTSPNTQSTPKHSTPLTSSTLEPTSPNTQSTPKHSTPLTSSTPEPTSPNTQSTLKHSSPLTSSTSATSPPLADPTPKPSFQCTNFTSNLPPLDTDFSQKLQCPDKKISNVFHFCENINYYLIYVCLLLIVTLLVIVGKCILNRGNTYYVVPRQGPKNAQENVPITMYEM